jgi:hypothetical protein
MNIDDIFKKKPLWTGVFTVFFTVFSMLMMFNFTFASGNVKKTYKLVEATSDRLKL